jgi:predicted acetyltransferase
MHAMYATGPLRDETELRDIAAMLSWSFNFPLADAEPWLRRAGLENIRVAREGDRAVGCLIVIPMGQFFGGRSVPMVGIAGVATAPERRGSGASTALMRATVEELARAGTPLSGLYPATRTLYRGVGYEPAGSRFEYVVPLASIATRERGVPMVPIDEVEEAEITATYRAYAARHDGNLDRGPYVWNRIRAFRNERVMGWAVGGKGRVEGYVYLYQKLASPTDKQFELRVTDAVALTRAATSRLLTFFADHKSLAKQVIWHGGPGDPLVQALPEVGYTVSMPMAHWMLRITDAPAALSARGYLDAVRTEVELDVVDALLPHNGGRLVLSVAGGAGEVRRGGSGALRIDVRGLAALYTGHASPTTLVSLGLLEGSAEHLARLAVAFTGPSPWMHDFF